jgi:hypothetical protein
VNLLGGLGGLGGLCEPVAFDVGLLWGLWGLWGTVTLDVVLGWLLAGLGVLLAHDQAPFAARVCRFNRLDVLQL